VTQSPPEPSPPRAPRQLHPLPKGLVELYGLLAVLVVLVPEWMAEGALLGWPPRQRGAVLPPASSAWQKVPELRLASMGLAELRLLAADLHLSHYGRLRRERLTARLLKRLKRRKAL
jgi:hypothetical protein